MGSDDNPRVCETTAPVGKFERALYLGSDQGASKKNRGWQEFAVPVPEWLRFHGMGCLLVEPSGIRWLETIR